MAEEAVKPISQVLVEVSKKVGAVKKEGWNSNNKYHFRGIDGVMNAVHPALCECGVFMQPEVLETEFSTAKTNNQKIVNVVRIKYKLTFHGPAGDSISVVVWGEANDYGDKATSKAHSVALRTALLQALCLPTEERDPDEDSFEVASGPTEEQKAAFQDLSARLQGVGNADALQVIINEAKSTKCLPPLSEQIPNAVAKIARATNDNGELQKLWKSAESAGVLDRVRSGLQQRAGEVKQAANAER